MDGEGGMAKGGGGKKEGRVNVEGWGAGVRVEGKVGREEDEEGKEGG